MSQPSTALQLALMDRMACIKISGPGNCKCGPDLKHLAEELWTKHICLFVFDLCECTAMDSSFLGVLAGIGMRCVDEDGNPITQPPELRNPNPGITQAVNTLGVAHLFRITNGVASSAIQYESIASMRPCTKADVARTSLEAHQNLIACDKNNTTKFKDVSDFLAKEVQRLNGADPK